MSEDPPALDVWTIEGVNDGEVTFLVNGEVIILHTSVGTQNYVDDLFAGRAAGRPVELKKEQAIRLARLILSVLEGTGEGE